ncbi:MAG: hypothetical protein WA364_06270, partial [Candidatus Nitrosopolaris sp.]
ISPSIWQKFCLMIMIGIGPYGLHLTFLRFLSYRSTVRCKYPAAKEHADIDLKIATFSLLIIRNVARAILT